MSRVITLGTFDCLHPGHVHLFKQCKNIADGGHVTVAVNSDHFVQSYKGFEPIQGMLDRMIMVGAVRWVDEVVVNHGGRSQAHLIEKNQPDQIVIGDDWAPPRDYLGQLGIDQAWLDRRGIQVIYLPRIGGHSSTSLKGRIRGDLDSHAV